MLGGGEPKKPGQQLISLALKNLKTPGTKAGTLAVDMKTRTKQTSASPFAVLYYA